MQNAIGVVVIDDIRVERMMLKALITSHPSLRWLGEADSASGALEIIHRQSPDAIFLDVMMPGATGFELLGKLERVPKVVMVSSSPHHAFEAFEVEAVDYLLKPVEPRRFAAAVRRLENSLNRIAEPVPLSPSDRICLRTAERSVIMPIESIAALEAEGDFTRVLAVDGASFLVSRHLGAYEALLPKSHFLRVDRSLMINTKRLDRIDRSTRNSSKVWLRGISKPLAVGRTATERLRQVIDW